MFVENSSSAQKSVTPKALRVNDKDKTVSTLGHPLFRLTIWFETVSTHHKNSGKISVDRETSPLSSLTIPGCNEVVYKGCITSKVRN